MSLAKHAFLQVKPSFRAPSRHLSCGTPDGLSYSQKRWFTLGLAEAKKPETRARRIDKYVGMLAEGRAR